MGRRSLAGALVLVSAVSAQAADSDDEAKARLLLSRVTYGARPGELEHILEVGLDRWLWTQLHPERIDDGLVEKKLEPFGVVDASTADLMDAYPRPTAEQRRGREMPRESVDGEKRRARPRGGMGPGRVLLELSQAKLLRAIYSERQLQEVLTEFWFNHFNVYARKSRNTLLAIPSYERDAIRPNVLGKFEDLLVATSQHPAMLFYLDNWVNAKEGFEPGTMVGRHRRSGQARRLGINENYARELLELHTLGVDAGYTQEDVEAVARAFTGWSVVGPRLAELRARMGGGSRRGRLPRALAALPKEGSFYFNPLAHDENPKVILGTRVAAGGMEDGRQVLHMLATHPATARFISSKLAERFVSDSPSDALVGEMAKTFRDSGGDIREVLSVLFHSERFVSEGLRAEKVKTPLELVVSSARATSAEVTGPGLVRTLFELGMPLYMSQPPTGYEEEASAWLTAGSVLARIRFAEQFTSGRIRGVGPLKAPSDFDHWIASVLPLGTGSEGLVTRASRADDGMSRVLASPAFQRQ